MKLAKKLTTYATIIATAITGLTLIMLLFDTKLFGEMNKTMEQSWKNDIDNGNCWYRRILCNK